MKKSINLSLNDLHGKCILFGLMVCTSVLIFRAVGSGAWGGGDRGEPTPISHWFKYVYGTPKKIMAAWPRLKPCNFDIFIL